LLGIETLPLRIEKSCENALSIARFLEQHPAVNSVNYPGLATSPFHGIARRQFGNRFGGILTFDLGTRERSFALIDVLQLIRRATNVNDNKTLIIHPASTIFGEFSPAEQTAMRIPDGQIRLSLGIEDAADIIEDLSQGLERL
jgi:O-acetylhomoserine (thiol)-lyase